MKKLFNCVSILLLFVSAEASNSYTDLVEDGLISLDVKAALHLGCGEVHLPGYINIDFPKKERSLHSGSAADYYCNITQLYFPKGSINKIENHHVFEHFSRPVSLALLCAWSVWLCEEGTLVIETPDFEFAINRYQESNSFEERQVIIRHLFGSHEAAWAVHWDAWNKDKFSRILIALGFEIQNIQHSSWRSTDNIQVIAKKIKTYSISELKLIINNILKYSMVDASEALMLEIWQQDFEKALYPMIESN